MKIIKMNKLKPCPFCGGEVEKFTAPLQGTQMFVCGKCGADVCFYGAEHEPKATKVWNMRFLTPNLSGIDKEIYDLFQTLSERQKRKYLKILKESEKNEKE